jgi:hypothetical protein
MSFCTNLGFNRSSRLAAYAGYVVLRTRLSAQGAYKYALAIANPLSSSCERACASAREIKRPLIYGRTLFKFAGHILHMTTSYMGYTLIRFTHRGHACMINCSLIYGSFLFKFAVNILQISTSSKGYVLFMFTHRTHTCERACASARVAKYVIYLQI